METPSSTRILTRSQTRTASRNGEERCGLIDITNDSPIVGLAGKSASALFGKGTPLSSVRQMRPKSTPGSGAGEALLRGQVKTLLQKVEEEAHISGFLESIKSTANRAQLRSDFQFLNSPMGILLAPTPANTPQVSGSVGEDEEPLVVFAEYPIEAVGDLFDKKLSDDKSLITRSLLFDFSEKSDLSTVEEDSAADEEEDASVWSIQVNESIRGADEDFEEELECYEEEEDEEEIHEEEGDDEGLDELCEGMRKISVVEFQGKHTRFVYNSEDEIEGEIEVLPISEGKQLRFEEEEDDV